MELPEDPPELGEWCSDDETPEENHSSGDETPEESHRSDKVCEPVERDRKQKRLDKSCDTSSFLNKNCDATHEQGKSSPQASEIRKIQNAAKNKIDYYARNYSYASKMQCVDRDSVEEFLASSVCGCKNECLKKLNTMKEHGAVEAVLQLRKQRFASTMGSFFLILVLTPRGVKIYD